MEECSKAGAALLGIWPPQSLEKKHSGPQAEHQRLSLIDDVNA